MGEQAKSKRRGYTIRIRDRLPADLGDKISRLHASALLDGRYSPQRLGSGQESQGGSDVEPQNPITDTG